MQKLYTWGRICVWCPGLETQSSWVPKLALALKYHLHVLSAQSQLRGKELELKVTRRPHRDRRERSLGLALALHVPFPPPKNSFPQWTGSRSRSREVSKLGGTTALC